MKCLRQCGTPSGFTLIELLCVMAIITLLAGLLLGPASRALQKARAMRWANEAEVQMALTVEQLQRHYRGSTSFPPVTLPDLEVRGLLGSMQIQFLKDPRVEFMAFSSTDPDDKIVISVQLEKGFITDPGVMTVTKGLITRPQR